MALLEADIQKTNPGAALDDSNAADFWGFRTKRFTRLASRTPSFAELLDHDLIGPGEREQVLHRDIALWPSFIDGANDAPEAMVSILLALSDFTEEVGAARVVPGSHRWSDFRRPADPTNYVSAAMPAGSALLYLGKTVHGAGANATQHTWRRGAACVSPRHGVDDAPMNWLVDFKDAKWHLAAKQD